tara:strand:+ start:2424 stop:4334 length:1911 start_codon:yes stop_codon:yes gene_type:complete
MSKLFNWGSEDMEQQRIKEQREFEMMLEQALNREKMPKHAAGGGGLTAAGSDSPIFTGVVIDGPIVGATVSSNVGTAVTDANGNFKLSSIASGVITVTGGVDSITGLAYEGELVGYAEYKTISPITTFAHYLKKASEENLGVPTLTIDEAITKTFTDSFDYFSISLPIEDKDIILQKDYIKEAIVNNNKVGISAQAVGTLIEAVAETIGVSLDGSKQAVEGRKIGKVIPEFSAANRKRSAYQAYGRASIERAGFDVDDIIQKVKFFNPANGKPQEGVSFENEEDQLPEQLRLTSRGLAILAIQEQYTNNYLTTRIQAVNRAQKTIIKNEIRNVVESAEGVFTDISKASVSPEVENALNRIEKDKANETTAKLDGAANVIDDGDEGFVFKQLKQNKKTGNMELTTLEDLDVKLSGGMIYFGKPEDTPLLLTEEDNPKGTGYTTLVFNGTDDITKLNAVTPNTPLYVEVTEEDAAFNIVTTYTLLPTQSNRKGELGIQLTVRLSRVSEEKVKKVIKHIVSSKEGTYTAVYTKDSDKENPISYSVLLQENVGPIKGTWVLDTVPPDVPSGLNQYRIARYDSKSTLLDFGATNIKMEAIRDLVFSIDNVLIVDIPEIVDEKTGEVVQEKAAMRIGFTFNA